MENENKANEIILQYLIEEEKQKPEVAAIIMEKTIKYDDIKQDFLRWLKDREYKNSPLSINGYTPQKISELAPFLHGIGVYNFMVDLRDTPEKAQSCIDEGFPIL